MNKTALITGATSGIGKATAQLSKKQLSNNFVEDAMIDKRA
jgi:NADP-dependent 3-hydroxy acid dehydrogenase YdfG